jgi:hypothetical protein
MRSGQLTDLVAIPIFLLLVKRELRMPAQYPLSDTDPFLPSRTLDSFLTLCCDERSFKPIQEGSPVSSLLLQTSSFTAFSIQTP